MILDAAISSLDDIKQTAADLSNEVSPLIPASPTADDALWEAWRCIGAVASNARRAQHALLRSGLTKIGDEG